jgi:hypothetical protein
MTYLKCANFEEASFSMMPPFRFVLADRRFALSAQIARA